MIDLNFEIKLIGINNASTFTGFCNQHDTSVFRPLETNIFQSSPHHTFLLGYRSLCKELFAKQQSLAFNTLGKQQFDKGKRLLEQIDTQENLMLYGMGLETAIRDLRKSKTMYDNILLRQDFSSVFYYIIRISETPDILCSGQVLPTIDFNGNELQDLMELDKTMDQCSFSIIATNSGGAVVFSWIGYQKAPSDLIASLNQMTNNQIPHAIIRFAFQYFENTFISPSWWDALPDSTRNSLIERWKPDPIEVSQDQKALTDDGIRAVSWKVTSRDTNLKL